jgi:hypothetical protein
LPRALSNLLTRLALQQLAMWRAAGHDAGVLIFVLLAGMSGCAGFAGIGGCAQCAKIINLAIDADVIGVLR